MGHIFGITRGVGEVVTGYIPVKNYTTKIVDISKEDLEKFGSPYILSYFQAKPHPYWAGKMCHCHILTIPGEPNAGLVIEEPEYEQFAAFGTIIGQPDVTGAIVMSHEIDHLGMDANEMGWDERTGKPLPKTLRSLDLEHVIPDLWKS